MPDERHLWADPAARAPQRGWFERSAAPSPAPPQGEENPPPPRRRGRIALTVALALLALAGAGIAGAALAGGDEQPQRKPVAASARGTLTATRIASIFTAVAPGVVQVRAGDRTGAGFVLRDDGTIVTSAHVVAGASQVRVAFDDPDQPVAATVLGADEASDLAVLHVDPAAAPRLRPLPLGASDALHVGDPALAIAYPRGLDRAVLTGIVSGLGKEISGPDGISLATAIQTDAAAGAGAPVLNTSGLVVGLTTQIAGRAGATRIAVAVPSSTLREVVPRLEAGQGTAPTTGQRAGRPYLGVSTIRARTGEGALVDNAVAGGPADRAGLQGASATGFGGGDTILGIDTTPVATPDDLVAAVAAHRPGDVVTLLVERSGQRFNLDVTLGTRPQGSP